jgi:hypothetical protein
MQVSVQFPGISVIILDVLYVVYINECSPKSLNYSVLENKSADVSIIFERLQKLCYTQNLVKNYWLRLRRDFLLDINKNLNILAQTPFILAFDFWINAWWYKMANFIPCKRLSKNQMLK